MTAIRCDCCDLKTCIIIHINGKERWIYCGTYIPLGEELNENSSIFFCSICQLFLPIGCQSIEREIR